ncbi:DUF1648 domain-containing protein [Collinsella vaginalis]|uniref:DUF1648 domain-containing protein n=1 Tax=Collinsella vaginalis TaxID=1870987 RepID=UPI000A26831B|nr:DUF5808 domain-containing protein [Collinsella vaginalis]
MSVSMVQSMFLAVLIAVVGATAAMTPWLMPATECFAVTVPAANVVDPRLHGLKRRYTVQVLIIIVVICAAMALPAVFSWDMTAALAYGIVLVTLSVALPFFLMLRYRGRVQEIKRSEGWRATGARKVAALGERELPRPASLRWELTHLAAAAVAAIIGWRLLPQMPARVPIHFDLTGAANGWVERGPLAALMPAGIVLLLGVFLAMAHLAIVRSKRPVVPGSLATSAWAYAVFARAQSLVLLATGALLDVCFMLIPLQMAGMIPLGSWIALILLAVAVALVPSAWIFVSLGQNGSRLAGHMASPDAEAGIPVDDDRFWHAGVFYANAADPAVVVPKRFGAGWTVNFARPATWAIIAALVLLIAAVMVISLAQ